MDQFLILIFQLIVLLFSVIIHEVSHGVMANKLGDPTAKNAGRLTLNPLKHLDFFGSFLLPFLLFMARSSVLFGWAKPVPFNPANLRNPKRDSGLIGLAGPLSNLSIAIIFGLILKSTIFFGIISGQFLIFLDIIILINIALAIFNLMPIPPLDGSKILFALLPRNKKIEEIEIMFEQYGIFILLFFIFFGFQFITPIIYGLYRILGSGL
ncbi:MAG: site-2 protease family protein, partial [Patescibacteria group bacterium]